MSEENLYAAPESSVITHYGNETHVPLSLQQKLWGFHGRISRAGYWGYTAISLLALIPAIIPFIIAVAVYGEHDTPPPPAIALMLTGLLLMLPHGWMRISIHVKRLHDKGMSGWLFLLNMIPIGDLVIFIICGCIAGDKGKNMYGDDPLLADGKKHL